MTSTSVRVGTLATASETHPENGHFATSGEQRIFRDLPSVGDSAIPSGPARLALSSRGLIPPTATDCSAASYRVVSMLVTYAIWNAHDFASGMNDLHETEDDLIDEFTGEDGSVKSLRQIRHSTQHRPSRVEVLWRRLAIRHRFEFDDESDAYAAEIAACESFLSSLLRLPGFIAEQVADAITKDVA